MDEIAINFNVKYDIKAESIDSLIATVGIAFPVAAWMTAMGTGAKVAPSNCAPNEAWAELYRRSNEAKKTCAVKNFVPDAMKNRIFSISPSSMSCTVKDTVTEMSVVGGFIVPSQLKDKEETKAAVALEVAIESILFAQENDPTTKKKASSVVDPIKAAELDVPVFPLLAAYGGKSYEAKAIEADLRRKEKRKAGVVTEFLVSNFPKTVPSGKKAIEWTGVSFSSAIPYRAPKVLNQNSLFQIISDHRRVRGTDSGRRSMYSKGYYYGYMDSPTSRACHIVADLENLVRATTGKRFLEIQNVDKLFTEMVITSLIANGWVIRVINGYGLKIFDCSKSKKGDISPGAYYKVIKCAAPFFVYHNLDEKTPTIVKNESSKLYEVNLPPILDRLSDMKETSESRIPFTYVYYRDELTKMRSNLYVSSHAHAAQLIYCTIANKNAVDMYEYAKRVLLANAYKTGFTYYRVPFFSRDQFKFDFSFNMTMKAKVVPSKAWLASDFEVTILTEKIEKIVIDYEELRRRAPTVVNRLMVVDRVAPDEIVTMTMDEVSEEDDDREEKDNDHRTIGGGVMENFSFGDELVPEVETEPPEETEFI